MASLSVFMDARRKKTVSDAGLPRYIQDSFRSRIKNDEGGAACF